MRDTRTAVEAGVTGGSGADWDLSPYFPEIAGPAYRTFRETLDADVARLHAEVRALGGLAPDGLDAWSAWLLRLEDASARSSHLGSYLACLGAADAGDETVTSEAASAAAARTALEKIFVDLRAALGAADEATFRALVEREELAPVRFFLERQRERAAFAMEPELEALGAELSTTGIQAWARLYDQVSGKLGFALELRGRPQRSFPVSMARSLLADADPAVRRAALSGSNRAWKEVADVVAACLNGIAGTRLVLQRRRGVAHFLDPALFDAAISRRTLDAMWAAVDAHAELPRGYLRRKARLLGQGRLGWQDLSAPLPLEDPRRIPWDEARERVLAAFGGFHPELREFAEQAFERRWIDWTPRESKRPGGFCSSSPVLGESRVFMTYHGALGDVSTLAHELGHAYHAWVMRDMRPWARRYPMTLAETASTFAESLLSEAVLADPEASAQERAVLLDGRMQDAAAFLLNIPVRFRFESALYEERGRGEVSVSRLRELMVAAQRACYGDTLFEDELDPWFWASKLHFYIGGLSFYNFPYTFGYLFSLGLFARARAEGADFLPRYRALLRDTGSDRAEGVARRHLGVDLESETFWSGAIACVADDARRFDEALGALRPGSHDAEG